MYKCLTPIVLIIFNRPESTKLVFEKIREVKPLKLYIISDGPRENNELDLVKNLECKKIVEKIDWECELIKVYEKKNLGCKKRIITGLNYVFNKEEKAIILEDDCIPNKKFFEFCEWGLKSYSENKNIGIISGSNLLDYQIESKNIDFSIYINCWGWATWKRTWEQFDEFLSIQELNKVGLKFTSERILNKMEKIYWFNIFKHSIYSNSVWDFYLQYLFFEKKMYSLYPKYNLIENIGFNEESTHTKKKMLFVDKSKPKVEKYNKLELKYNKDIRANESRDKQVIRKIYGYSIFSTIKLILGNILRYCGFLK